MAGCEDSPRPQQQKVGFGGTLSSWGSNKIRYSHCAIGRIKALSFLRCWLFLFSYTELNFKIYNDDDDDDGNNNNNNMWTHEWALKFSLLPLLASPAALPLDWFDEMSSTILPQVNYLSPPGSCAFAGGVVSLEAGLWGAKTLGPFWVSLFCFLFVDQDASSQLSIYLPSVCYLGSVSWTLTFWNPKYQINILFFKLPLSRCSIVGIEKHWRKQSPVLWSPCGPTWVMIGWLWVCKEDGKIGPIRE